MSINKHGTVDIHPEHIAARVLLSLTGILDQADDTSLRHAKVRLRKRGTDGVLDMIEQHAGAMRKLPGQFNPRLLEILNLSVDLLLVQLEVAFHESGTNFPSNDPLLQRLKEMGYALPDRTLKVKEPE